MASTSRCYPLARSVTEKSQMSRGSVNLRMTTMMSQLEWRRKREDPLQHLKVSQDRLPKGPSSHLLLSSPRSLLTLPSTPPRSTLSVASYSKSTKMGKSDEEVVGSSDSPLDLSLNSLLTIYTLILFIVYRSKSSMSSSTCQPLSSRNGSNPQTLPVQAIRPIPVATKQEVMNLDVKS